MRADAAALEAYLSEIASRARRGDRLPAVRELMSRFGLSQPVVQRSLHGLQQRGLVEVRPGQGVFVADPEAVAVPADGPEAVDSAWGPPARSVPRPRSVLVLRRSVNVDRGRHFADQLLRRFEADGHRVIEVRFSDAGHARTVLKGLPRFDACVVQSVYHGIPADLLAMLQDKCRVVAFDGVSMIMEGVDSVGTEWGEPLAQAVSLLRAQGHEHLCFAATSRPLLATTLGWRRWAHLAAERPSSGLHRIELPQLPDEGYLEALVEALAERLQARPAAFTGLVAWGVSDGARFRELLQQAGLAVPRQLSVVLLGRTDHPVEHDGFFEAHGPRIEDQVARLYDTIVERWAGSTRAWGAEFVPVTRHLGGSVAAPPRDRTAF